MSDLWGPEKSDGAGDELTPKRLLYIEQCRSDPASYFWGKDPESNLHVVRTLDAHDKVTPIKPLPIWPYLGFVLARFAHRKKVVIDKPRQLLLSWMALLWFDYLCLFQPYRTCLLNKATMDEAKRMLFKRLGIVHKHWPKWFADWAQVVELRSDGEIRYERAGGVIVATGENVEDRAARGDQAASAIVDEAARHPNLREVIAALAPMADQLILISTPELGNPGAAFMNELLNEGRS